MAKTISDVLADVRPKLSTDQLRDACSGIRRVLKSELFVGPETESKMDEIMG